jgi:hypothetical protein
MSPEVIANIDQRIETLLPTQQRQLECLLNTYDSKPAAPNARRWRYKGGLFTVIKPSHHREQARKAPKNMSRRPENK